MGCSYSCEEEVTKEKRNLKKEDKNTDYPNRSNKPFITRNSGELNTSKYGVEDLKLKAFNFYQNEIDADFSTFKSTSRTYHKLGPFNFGINPQKIGKIRKRSKEGCVYIGETKDKKRNGIGILVNNGGYISEGYWRKGRLHGPGRIIWCFGNYEIGEYKNGSLYNGAIYNKNGVALSVYNKGELISKDFNGDLALYSGSDISSDISSETEANSN